MLKKYVALAAGLSLGSLALLVYTGCSVDSANGVSRTVSINVGGIYRYNSSVCGNDGRFVTANSGKPVISFDLRQAGDTLEAIDNNGIIYRGTIGSVQDTSASFNLEGTTTAGNSALVSGNISVSGNQGIMQATWIEDSFFATLCGSSTGQSVNTNTPPEDTNGLSNAFFRVKDLQQSDLAAYAKLVWWTAGS